MLTPDERAALVVYCHDHPVAVCPQCSGSLRVSRIIARSDFCPTCRTDLTDSVRQHLTACTWMRVQGREVRERARAVTRGSDDGAGPVSEVVFQLGHPVRRADRVDIGVVVGLLFGAPERALVRWKDGASFEPVKDLIEVRATR
jgi:hypothetical protein